MSSFSKFVICCRDFTPRPEEKFLLDDPFDPIIENAMSYNRFLNPNLKFNSPPVSLR